MERVSYSEAKVFDTCEKQWTFTYGMGLYPVGDYVSDAVAIGRYGHTYLEVYFKALMQGMSKTEALDKILKVASEDTSSNSLKGMLAAVKYAEARPEDGKPIMVEQKIRVPVFENLEFSFVPDLVWEYTSGPWKGMISVDDFKFVQRKWSEAAITMYRQVPLYLYFLQQHGYPNARKGVIWFINRDTGDYKRHVLNPSKEELIGFAREHSKTAQRILEFRTLPTHVVREVARRTSNTDACQKCFFVFPCKLELGGNDISKTLRSNYEEYKKDE